MGYLGGAIQGFTDTTTKRQNKKVGNGSSDSNGGSSIASKVKKFIQQKFGQPKTPVTSPSTTASPGYYKRGGKVKRGGMARVHKGERVLTKSQQRRMKMKGRGRRGSSKR
jgi:hypothetical protein